MGLEYGHLYFKNPDTGEYDLIGHNIENVDLATDVESEYPKLITGTFEDKATEIKFTVITDQRNRNLFLSLIYGRFISNNWLKMHGGVMTRKWKKKKNVFIVKEGNR